MLKSIIKIIGFLSLILAILGITNKVFKFKYDDIYFKDFYKLESNTLDVLTLGSSHSFAHINTPLLWNEYGIAGFNLGASSQPLYFTYYYLKEALKTQKPKLIILEAFTALTRSEYINIPFTLRNTLGMKWSKNKIDMIKVCANRESWKYFFLEYTQYHKRYIDLVEEDFKKRNDNIFSGFYPLIRTDTNQVEPKIGNITERIPMTEKEETYLRKTIELVKENNINLFIIISPWPTFDENCQKIYNSVMDIAYEYDILFKNYNLLPNIGLNYSTDMADTGHLNYYGTKKFTDILAKDIKANFDIPDRRGNNKYDTWENETTRFKEFLKANEIDYDS